MLFADRGLRVRSAKSFDGRWRRRLASATATGKVSWASVGPAVKLPPGASGVGQEHAIGPTDHRREPRRPIDSFGV